MAGEDTSGESVLQRLRSLGEPGALEGIQLFHGVSIDTVAPILEQCPVLNLHAGERLITAGEGNRAVYLVLRGRLRVHLEAGDSQPVAMLGAGESVGEISVVDKQPTSASVIADSESTVLAVNEALLWTLVKSSHAIACNLLEILAQRLRHGNSVINRIHDLLREYEHDASIDPLTGLFNRRWLENMLRRLLQRARAAGQELALAMIDVDNFKAYNDSHGHLAGDRALFTVARSVVEHLRPEDSVARYGGEEMLALLPNTDLTGARLIGERLRSAVESLAITAADGTALPGVTISVGVADMRPDHDAPDLLVKAADEALYRAKRIGRNAVSD